MEIRGLAKDFSKLFFGTSKAGQNKWVARWPSAVTSMNSLRQAQGRPLAQSRGVSLSNAVVSRLTLDERREGLFILSIL
jgi:hypothetical protein